MHSEQQPTTKVISTDNKDWFLQDLIEIANAGKLSFDITLTVGGFLISGTLVGGKEYFDGFGEEFTIGLKGTAADRVKAAFAKNGEMYGTPNPELKPSYIHLKNARVFHTSGAPIPENRGIWWRGRISEVSGFSLGALIEEK